MTNDIREAAQRVLEYRGGIGIHCIVKQQFPNYGADVDALARHVLAQPAPAIDDPEFDGTDFAHPAWWRGHEHTIAVTCQKVNEILDGKDDGAGENLEGPWRELRRRLLGMVQPAPAVAPDHAALIAEAHSFMRQPGHGDCDREDCENNIDKACTLLCRVTDALEESLAREAEVKIALNGNADAIRENNRQCESLIADLRKRAAGEVEAAWREGYLSGDYDASRGAGAGRVPATYDRSNARRAALDINPNGGEV